MRQADLARLIQVTSPCFSPGSDVPAVHVTLCLSSCDCIVMQEVSTSQLEHAKAI